MTSKDDNSSKNSLLINIEQQFRQLVAESQTNEMVNKITQEKLDMCLKRNILLEHELETERFNKSMIKMELDTLTSVMNKYNSRDFNNSELDVNVLMNNQEYLMNKIFKIQVENMELKQKLSKSNVQISSLLATKQINHEKIDLLTSMLDSLQIQIQQLKKESHLLTKILCNSKILGIKILSVLEYSKKFNETQYDQFHYLIKEVANIKSKVHLFIDQNEKQQLQIVENNQKCTTISNQTESDIYKTMVEILEVENNALHKSVCHTLE